MQAPGISLRCWGSCGAVSLLLRPRGILPREHVLFFSRGSEGVRAKAGWQGARAGREAALCPAPVVDVDPPVVLPDPVEL
eukprot:8370929-Pyramimonas_sp.AAC.1